MCILTYIIDTTSKRYDLWSTSPGQFGFQVLFVRPFFMDPVAICRSWAGPIGIDLWLCLKIECVQFHRTAISKTHPFWWNWKHYHLWSSISIFDNSINSILSSLTIKFWRESPIFRQAHMIVCRHRCSACTQARVQIRGSTKKRKKEPFTYIYEKKMEKVNQFISMPYSDCSKMFKAK